MNRLIVILILLLASSSTAAQDAVVSLEPRLPGLADRLRNLSPSEPAPYILLGEEVGAEAATDAEVALARHLLVLGYALAREADPRGDLPATAALALADLTADASLRRWLRSLATLLRPGAGIAVGFARSSEPEAAGETAFRAATALGYVRSGDGNRAGPLLRDERVRDILRRYSALVRLAPGSILTTLDREAAYWPCPECKNDRVVRERADGTVITRLCNTCAGSPGWRPDDATFIGTLRLEAALLAGVQRTWSAQYAYDGGEPLRDLDPDALPRLLGVDPTLTRFDSGRWAR